MLSRLGLAGETRLLLRGQRSELLRDTREHDIAERRRFRRLDQAAPTRQHVIDQRPEAVIVAVLTQQRERISKFLGQRRVPAPAVGHGFLVGHRSSLVVVGVSGRCTSTVHAPTPIMDVNRPTPHTNTAIGRVARRWCNGILRLPVATERSQRGVTSVYSWLGNCPMIVCNVTGALSEHLLYRWLTRPSLIMNGR